MAGVEAEADEESIILLATSVEEAEASADEEAEDPPALACPESC